MVERWGRKSTLVVFLLLNAVGAFAGSEFAVFVTFTVILIIGGVTVFALGEETKGRTLEEISGS